MSEQLPSKEELYTLAPNLRSLDQFINGSDSETVLTRLSAEYPTLQNAISQINSKLDKADAQIEQSIATLFENGGIADRFKTVEQMQTEGAELPEGSYALVADDVAEKNGIYIKETGSWVKSKYDVLQQAKSYISDVGNDILEQAKIYSEDNLGALVNTTSNSELFVFSDADGKKVAEIKSDAGLYLAGFDGEVQEALNNGKLLSNYVQYSGDVKNLAFAFVDSKDNILLGIDKKAGVRIAGTRATLQDHLCLYDDVIIDDTIDERFFFSDACNKYFMNLVARGVKHPPVPHGLLPQDYTLPDSIINSFTLTAPVKHIPLNTPYGIDDKVVHPYVVKLSAPFRGYNYLMCITPYTVEPHENPTIFGSKDSDNWEMLSDIDQPLQSPRDYEFLSDNGLAFDPVNGLLVCYWRRAELDSSNANLYYRTTRDGIKWSETALLKEYEVGASVFSPSILFNPNDGYWHLWVHRNDSILKHYKSKTLNNKWEVVSEKYLASAWHLEVKYIGDKYLLLNNKRDPNSNFYFAISSDGDNWVQGKALYETQQDALYKASFIPNLKDNQLSFDIFYTTNHAVDPVKHRKFFKAKTNTISI